MKQFDNALDMTNGRFKYICQTLRKLQYMIEKSLEEYFD